MTVAQTPMHQPAQRALAAIHALAALLLLTGLQQTASAAVAPPEPAFDIFEYQVVGNEVLPVIAIERAVYPHLGPGKRVEDVEKARTALENAYHQAGYLSVLVDIPEQEVKGGLVTLRVLEGKVERLRVTGSRYYSQGAIRSALPAVQPGSVPNFGQLQQELGALATIPDRSITRILKAGASPGTLDVEMKVEDTLPLHGSLELNNRQTPNTEPLRLQASLRYDNLWQRGHSISLWYQTAPQEPRQLRVGSASYVWPLSAAGDALAVYGVKSDSDVAAVGATDVIGKGSIVGVRNIIALRPQNGYTYSLTLGLDSKDFGETVRLGSDTFETPIHYVPIIAEYRFAGPVFKGSQSGSMSLNSAPRGLFGNSDEEFSNKRANARASYLYLRGDWLTEQPLLAKTTLGVRLQGQFAGQPLISNEQFAAGGAETVRGYLEAERLGDEGLIGSVELKHTLRTAETGLQALMAVAFIDAATLRVIDPLPGQEAHFDLYSVGIGLRARFQTYLDAAVDLALPLEDGQTTRRGEPRVNFRIAGRF